MLCDYGCAERIPEDGYLEGEKFKCQGTSFYYCPEILSNQKFRPESADIFSLGVVAFLLLVGEHPFEVACPENKKYKALCMGNSKYFWGLHS